ncbi:MAG: hypothetical protein FJX72_07425, partial [Armatimonadetes bacterium]|nr:hypothetical protein [Armatimonadota bacterium]
MISIASVLGLVALVQSGVRADMGDGRVTVSLKGGAFFPVHGAMKDQASDAWWYLGVDVDPGLRYKPANGTVHLGVDFK